MAKLPNSKHTNFYRHNISPTTKMAAEVLARQMNMPLSKLITLAILIGIIRLTDRLQEERNNIT